jgi:uncharacterized protein (DUF2225 family)
MTGIIGSRMRELFDFEDYENSDVADALQMVHDLVRIPSSDVKIRITREFPKQFTIEYKMVWCPACGFSGLEALVRVSQLPCPQCKEKRKVSRPLTENEIKLAETKLKNSKYLKKEELFEILV